VYTAQVVTDSDSELAADAPVLCVDLDGTLVRTDTLHEQILILLKTSPLGFMAAWFKLFHGIAEFKRAMSLRVTLRPDLLPYREELVAYLRGQAKRGRHILLVTAADRSVADGVARHLGFFEAVLASEGSTNLKSNAKVARIREYTKSEPFEYAGNSSADIPVWEAASAAILINPTRSIRRAVTRLGVSITKEFHGGGSFGDVVRAMRPHQWSKNLLIFAPVFLSHTIFRLPKLLLAGEAFLSFSVAASAIYIVNDLLDLDADRQHPRKRYRPFAAASLSVMQGIVLAAVLFSISAALSLTLPLLARLVVALYVVTSMSYTTYLKKMLFLDVITLAGLYTLRMLAGGVATSVVISPWTLAFSIFMFTSLAICKRLSELRAGGVPDDHRLPGRAYTPVDLSSLTSLASSSGYVAVLILALYLNSPEVAVLYRHPQVMWLLLPILTYWISRAIMIANRGEMHDDPIVFAFGDGASRVVGLAALGVVIGSL
jgi:4-hydroxybenzoate polyprenyltransferase/phosphoserine phosphatase